MEEGKEQEFSKKKVLEIGSGSHRFDNPDEERVYLDINLDLARRQRKWGVAPNKLDTVEVDVEKGLSFRSGSFDEVQILFPSGGLIKSITGGSKINLWPEISRVLKPSGSVIITAEDKYGSYSTNDLLIDNPQDLIKSQAELNGFKVEVEKVSEKELEELGTNSAKAAAENLRRNTGAIGAVYKITAKR